jgi:hypothetical protein
MGEAKVPVGERALLQRINRKLAQKDAVLKKLRGDHYLHELGSYYIVNYRFNRIEATAVDPVAFARELMVLAPWEEVRGDRASSTPPAEKQAADLPHDPGATLLKRRRKDALPPQTIEAIAAERQKHPDLSIRAFADHLFTSGVYRSIGRGKRQGEAVPAATSLVHRTLKDAEAMGVL